MDYALMRAGNLKPWTSGVVSVEDRWTENLLVSQLMDQVAIRVVGEIRKPHVSARCSWATSEPRTCRIVGRWSRGGI